MKVVELKIVKSRIYEDKKSLRGPGGYGDSIRDKLSVFNEGEEVVLITKEDFQELVMRPIGNWAGFLGCIV